MSFLCCYHRLRHSHRARKYSHIPSEKQFHESESNDIVFRWHHYSNNIHTYVGCCCCRCRLLQFLPNYTKLFLKWYLIKHFCSLKSRAFIHSVIYSCFTICLVLFHQCLSQSVCVRYISSYWRRFSLYKWMFVYVWCIAYHLYVCVCMRTNMGPLKIIWIV